MSNSKNFTLLVILTFLNTINTFGQTPKKSAEPKKIYSNSESSGFTGTSATTSALGDNEVFIKSTYLEAGITTNGTFGSVGSTPSDFNNSGRISIISDYGKDGWNVGYPSRSGDYFLPGTNFEGFKVQFGSTAYSNNNSGNFQITGNNLGTKTSLGLTTALWQGEVAGSFQINQKIELAENDTYLKVSVKIKNLSPNASPVYYTKVADPDQEYQSTGIFATNNTIDNQVGTSGSTYSLINSKGYNYNIYLGYLSTDLRSKCAISPNWDHTPIEYYNGLSGNILSGSYYGDYSNAITFYEPNLMPGKETEFIYYILVYEADKDKVLCNPSGKITASKNSIYNGESSVLTIELTGSSPWTYDLNGVQYTTSNAITTLTVSPSFTTEYTLKGITNSCGKSTTGSSTLIQVIPCFTPTASLSGSTTIPYGSSTILNVSFTGNPPFNFGINGTSYTSSINPFTLEISPEESTLYEITSLSNVCGAGTFSGQAIVNITIDCDGNEPNNSSLTATVIPSVPFLSNQMCFHKKEDLDWFKFSINDKDYYIEIKFLDNTLIGNYRLRMELVSGILNIETIPYFGSDVDTYISLYDSDKTTVLAFDDDGGINLFSKILYNVCPSFIEHTSATLGEGVYFALNTISSVSNVSDKTFYYAGKSITLSPGFQVGNNELFLAEINACNSTTPLPTPKVLELQPGPTDGKDAVISLIIPNENRGDIIENLLYAWTQSGEINITRSLLQFDLTDLPLSSIIDSVKLDLYHNPIRTSPTTGHSSSSGFMIERVISNWEENTVTWNTQPNTVIDNFVTLNAPISNIQDYLNINITNLFKDIFSTNNFGIRIKLIDESIYKLITFTSSDYILDPSKRPKLKIFYH